MDTQTFQSGKTWTEYMESIQKNRDKFERVYDAFELHEPDMLPFRAAAPLHILAIGEDWCPDVYNTLGAMAKIADCVSGCELRIFERDTRTDIMDQFLTEGTKKSIPVFAFYDSRWQLLGWWAGRNKKANEWVTSFRKGRPYDQIPPEELKPFQQEFARRYETEYTRGNIEEIKAVLTAGLEKCGITVDAAGSFENS
jgi:hypothetical protein